MAYATLEDLAVRFPRALTAAETAQVPTMLEDASFVLSGEAPGVQAAVDAGDESVVYMAMLLTVAMVKRALLAQEAQQSASPAVEQLSEAWGPYSQSVRYRSDGANLFLYARELQRLEALLGKDQAVSIRSPGL